MNGDPLSTNASPPTPFAYILSLIPLCNGWRSLPCKWGHHVLTRYKMYIFEIWLFFTKAHCYRTTSLEFKQVVKVWFRTESPFTKFGLSSLFGKQSPVCTNIVHLSLIFNKFPIISNQTSLLTNMELHIDLYLEICSLTLVFWHILNVVSLKYIRIIKKLVSLESN